MYLYLYSHSLLFFIFSQGHIPWSYPRPPPRVLARSLPVSPSQRCHSINIGLTCASSHFHFEKTILTVSNVLILPLRKERKHVFLFPSSSHIIFLTTAVYITIVDSSSPHSSSACSYWPLFLPCLLFSRSLLLSCLMEWSFLSPCHT